MITPRNLQGYYKALQGNYKDTKKHVKDNIRSKKNSEGSKPKRPKTRLGLIRKHASAVC